MERPKKEDFEYYQNGLAFKTVDLIKYTKAQDLYIDHLKALNMHVVIPMLFGKSLIEYGGMTKDSKYKIYGLDDEVYIFINDFGDIDRMHKSYFEIMETK